MENKYFYHERISRKKKRTNKRSFIVWISSFIQRLRKGEIALFQHIDKKINERRYKGMSEKKGFTKISNTFVNYLKTMTEAEKDIYIYLSKWKNYSGDKY